MRPCSEIVSFRSAARNPFPFLAALNMWISYKLQSRCNMEVAQALLAYTFGCRIQKGELQGLSFVQIARFINE